MTDAFKWIDPFAEIERAREAGRDEVCAAVERDNEDAYRRLVHDELADLAYRHARQMFTGGGIPKKIEAAATQILERAMHQEMAMLLHASQPALRVYAVDDPSGLSVTFNSAEHFQRLG